MSVTAKVVIESLDSAADNRLLDFDGVPRRVSRYTSATLEGDD
jgi:hypothetical protein